MASAFPLSASTTSTVAAYSGCSCSAGGKTDGLPVRVFHVGTSGTSAPVKYSGCSCANGVRASLSRASSLVT